MSEIGKHIFNTVSRDARINSARLSAASIAQNEFTDLLSNIEYAREASHEEYSRVSRLTVSSPMLNSELEEFIESQIARAIAIPDVEEIKIDKKGRLLVTTRPLKVKKSFWKKGEDIGRYQFFIDFTEREFPMSVRCINIDYGHKTGGFLQHDTPTISGGMLCLGNVANEFATDFARCAIYELVWGIVQYIKSPVDGNGFTRWRNWFNTVKKRTRPTSIALWEKRSGASRSSRSPNQVPLLELHTIFGAVTQIMAESAAYYVADFVASATNRRICKVKARVDPNMPIGDQYMVVLDFIRQNNGVACSVPIHPSFINTTTSQLIFSAEDYIRFIVKNKKVQESSWEYDFLDGNINIIGGRDDTVPRMDRASRPENRVFTTMATNFRSIGPTTLMATWGGGD